MKTAITMAILGLSALQVNAAADSAASELSGVPLSVAARQVAAPTRGIGASEVRLSGAPMVFAKQPTAAPTPGEGTLVVALSGMPLNTAKLTNLPQDGLRTGTAPQMMAMHASGSGACASSAADSSMTSEQVQADLVSARLAGDIVANAESGLTLREVYPDLYPQQRASSSVTREQVAADLALARLGGDIVASSESGLTLREVYPDLYPTASTANGEQVKTGLAVATRTGDCLEIHASRHAQM